MLKTIADYSPLSVLARMLLEVEPNSDDLRHHNEGTPYRGVSRIKKRY